MKDFYINSGSPDSFLNALFVDLLLLILFGLQHTLMARTGFKRWFASVFPKKIFNRSAEGPDKVLFIGSSSFRFWKTMEKDWLDGWDYAMIHSNSGLAELNCVFSTPMHGDKDTYWIVSRYEPDDHRIEFVRFTYPEVIVKIAIEVLEEKNALTPVNISYTYTGLNAKQTDYIQNELEGDFERSMQWWEKSMNHNLHTGKLLRH